MIQFTEDNYPELMHVPLKGDMLREFVQLLRETSDPKLLHLPPDSEARQDPDEQRIYAIMKNVADAITQKLDSPGAIKFGLDTADLQALILNAAKIDIAAPTKSLGTYKAEDPEAKNVTFTMDEDAIAQHTAMYAMRMFSECLAVQEHKERELLSIVQTYMDQSKQAIVQLKFDDGDAGLKARNINGLAGNIVMGEQGIAVARARKSPVTELREQIMYGPEYPRTRQKKGVYELLDHMIAVLGDGVAGFGDVDSNTEAGRLNIRRIRDNALSKMRGLFGLPTREID